MVFLLELGKNVHRLLILIARFLSSLAVCGVDVTADEVEPGELRVCFGSSLRFNFQDSLPKSFGPAKISKCRAGPSEDCVDLSGCEEKAGVSVGNDISRLTEVPT